MATKTITVTNSAYEALKGMKEEDESFSEAIIRISGKRSIKEFVGALSSSSADKLKKAVYAVGQRHATAHQERMKKTVSGLEG
ncbi:MAG TPA: antitoxin VapB family protein [Candidatus Nanoarchaeia archaeon]|nr:antitoxin VapB family protein [Candidatus Nanoarchaeia archaeon]